MKDITWRYGHWTGQNKSGVHAEIASDRAWHAFFPNKNPDDYMCRRWFMPTAEFRPKLAAFVDAHADAKVKECKA